METWIKESIAQIKIICHLISEDKFVELEQENRFDTCSSIGIRDSIMQHLNGDDPKDGSLKRINVPTDNYVKENTEIFEINPKNPSEIKKRLEYDVMIDGIKSDLTIIFRVFFDDNQYVVKIYDALTL